MPITLSFGNHHHYEINASRLVRLMNSDKEQALYMGVWDRFKDNFRTQKNKMRWRYYIHSSTDVDVKSKRSVTLIQTPWIKYMPLKN